MFRVYHSNRLDLLKDLTGYLMERDPLPDPLANEVVLVQSPGMAQWLQMELAQNFSARVAANIQFPLPASFIWQMFVTILPGIPEQSAFNKTAMSWKLMHLLPLMIHQPQFVLLEQYLTDDTDKRKLFQLSNRIADLFDQYLVYRPDWLNRWQNQELIPELGEAQTWQAPLWRALVEYTAKLNQPPWHRANLYAQFIQTLEQASEPPPGLPARVFICGISALPPVYLQALQALGKHIEIHLLFTNPCQYYWGDIQDRAFLARLLGRQRYDLQREQCFGLFQQPAAAESLFSADGEQDLPNPLLASWGKQGRDNLFLLAQMDALDDEIHAFADFEPNNLLQQVQHDILTLSDHSVIGLTAEEFKDSQRKRRLDPSDQSIRISACHSAQREVEVLKDYLLHLLDADPQLQPRDIIVMVADIDSYSPFIQSVFAHEKNSRAIPFAISDRRASQVHPVVQAFLQLLALPDSRFTSEQVLALLEIPALAARFAIDEAGLKTLRRWVEESGIRWGLDDSSVTDLALPITGQHTWHFGVQRMLLGYAMESEQGDWQGILPYDESAGMLGELAGQLAELLRSLDQWRQTLNQSLTLTEWQPYCRQLIESFFIGDSDSQAALELIQQQWQQVIQQGIEACYDQAIPMTVLRDELRSRLTQQRISQRFLAGQVNFCTLMPMRSIPFKVVCLLGMNDGVYPRSLLPSGFDLMQHQRRRGDRSRRDDDRYLFLEALISAQQQLYISYIGIGIQDNQPCLPSVLVNELLDYLSQSFCLVGDETLDVDSSAQRLRRHVVQYQQRTPFAEPNFALNNPWRSYAREWLPAARGSGTAPRAFAQPLPELIENELEINLLLSFWRYPLRAWFNRRLDVNFFQEAVALPDSEPFDPDPLERYQVNQQLLNTLIVGEDSETFYRRQRLAGQLPYGAYGELFWQQQTEAMQQIADQVIPQRQTAISLEIDLLIDDCRLTGWIPQLQTDGLLRWRPGTLNFADGLLLWIEHLLVCATGRTVISRMYGRHASQWRFLPVEQETAKMSLSRLLSGYRQGLIEPLWLLKSTGGQWLMASIDKRQAADQATIDWGDETQAKARQKLITAWQDNYLTPGEGSDPYLQRLCRQLTEVEITQIIAAAETWYLPIYRAHRPESDT